jgi:transcriptional repressor NrdR
MGTAKLMVRLSSGRMHCRSCEAEDTRVVDSRAAEDGKAIRRRRACPICGERFTTFERFEHADLVVVKRDGRRVPFDRASIVRGIATASKGGALDEASIEAVADTVEDELRLLGDVVSSEVIGKSVLQHLRRLDDVSALRFASVYKGFRGVEDFEREMSLIKREQTPSAH